MTVVRFIFAIILVAVGWAGFITFTLFKNYPTAVLGAIVAITNSVLAHLHFLNYKRKLHEWYTLENIVNIGRFGLVIFTVGTMCLVYFSTIEIMLQKPIFPIETSCILAIVWSFITLKSGLVLFYYGHVYKQNTHQLIAESTDQIA